MAFGRGTSRRRSRGEREARARFRRRVAFAATAVLLIFGAHYAVDEISRPDTDVATDKAGMFANSPAHPAAAYPASPGDDLALPPLPDGPGFGAGAGIGAASAGAAAHLPAGMDPAMRAKASEMQKRYSDRLSRMSTQDKVRALNKASKLLGRDVRGMMGR